MKTKSLPFCIAALAGALAGYHPIASAQGNAFFAVLLGGNEVDASGQANQGDLNGFGTATIIIQKTADAGTETVCFGITVQGTDTPTAAHIHQARAGTNGPVVVSLAAPDAGAPGTASGCTENVPNKTISALKSEPAGFYVNVHSSAFPGGAMRGQIF